MVSYKIKKDYKLKGMHKYLHSEYILKAGLLLFLLFYSYSNLSAQKKDQYFIKEWKSYHSDSITFDYLVLKSDGTGFKGFGQTIDGEDEILRDDITVLEIHNWYSEKNKLYIFSYHDLMFKPESKYTISKKGKFGFEMHGEHLKLAIYPSYLNREVFTRSIEFNDASKLEPIFGATKGNCIVEQDLFSFEDIDSAYQIMNYIGFEDLIPQILGCENNFEFVPSYNDPPYQLTLPDSLKHVSFGFGNHKFSIGFYNDTDTSETSIVIYYDFNNNSRDHFLKKIEEGEEKEISVL